jgi:hypothetical protein
MYGALTPTSLESRSNQHRADAFITCMKSGTFLIVAICFVAFCGVTFLMSEHLDRWVCLRPSIEVRFIEHLVRCVAVCALVVFVAAVVQFDRRESRARRESSTEY